MQIIQKQLDKKRKRTCQIKIKNLDTKNKPETERKKSKIRRKQLYHKIKIKNLYIDKHRDFEISHEKITKHSCHNLKY